MTGIYHVFLKIRNTLLTIIISASLTLSGSSIFSMDVQAASGYCYQVTPGGNDALFDYLNEIYIGRYPELGLEYLYGTKKDKADLEKAAEIIFAGCKNDKEKCLRVSRWAKKYIKYEKYAFAQLPIDVLVDRKANCFGYAMLMTYLLRLVQVRAVVVVGGRGNMQENIRLDDEDDKKFNHAWLMAYHDGEWYLFDPLSGVEDCNNRQYIYKYYFPYSVEGITPYYEGMDTNNYGKYVNLYKNGKFMLYSNNSPIKECTEYFYDSNGVCFRGEPRFFDGTSGDGFDYIDEDRKSEKESMNNGEFYTNGWLTSLQYAQANGILVTRTFKDYNGKHYYMTYDGHSIEIPKDSSEYESVDGYIAIKKGETVTGIKPSWEPDEDHYIEYVNDSPDLITVSNDGTIKALNTGSATIEVYEKCLAEPDTHWRMSFILVNIVDEYRKLSYSDIELAWLRGHSFKDKSGSTYKILSKNEVSFVKGNKKAKNLTVPGTVTYNKTKYKVTRIENGACKNFKSLKTATIGANVKSIGDNAFNGCIRLTELKIGSNVTGIGSKAIYNCSSLKTLTLPAKTTKLGKQFAGKCKKLRTLTMKSSKMTNKTVANGACSGIGKSVVVKVPKSKISAYKKIFQKKGLDNKINVEKIK